MKKKLLGELLYRANSAPPRLHRKAFYEIKEQLLEQHGIATGYVVQHIKKDCWACDGTGEFGYWRSNSDTCWSCGGSGLYKSIWVRLVAYELGSHTFLVPKERHEHRLPPESWELPTLTDYVEHERLAGYRDAQIILFALFLPFPQFWRFMIGCGSSARSPLAFLQRPWFHFRQMIKAVRRTFWVWHRAVIDPDPDDGDMYIRDFWAMLKPYWQIGSYAAWDSKIPF